MIVLSYLWVLALIPFLVEKEDQEVKWHAKHGLILTGAEFLLWIVMLILQFVLTAVFAPIGCLFSILFFLVGIGLLVFHIICIVKGTKGERMLVPYLSEYAEKI